MADDRNQANTHMTDLAGRIRVESSDPTNPKAGDIYYNSTTNHLTYYTGSAWIGAPFVRV